MQIFPLRLRPGDELTFARRGAELGLDEDKRTKGVAQFADAGYDVADYCDIDPVYGTLGAAQDFLDEAHTAGLRVLLDIVPNHTSSAHRSSSTSCAHRGGRRACGR